MKYFTFCILLGVLSLTACQEGPAESFGESVDSAANNVGNAVENACEEVSNQPC
jgi:predicted small secreted protein